MEERIIKTYKYKGWTIHKVEQDNGRITYDTFMPDGWPNTVADHSLAVAKAEITAACR